MEKGTIYGRVTFDPINYGVREIKHNVNPIGETKPDFDGIGATGEGKAPSNLELAKSFYDLEKSWKGAESDPLGKDQHEGGAKLDAGKPRVALVMRDFAHALWEVARVGTYGAEKYCASGWMDVPDGINRYDDAMMRHKLKDWMGEKMDTDLPVEHLAQVAWNALAILERRIREEKDSKA